jgi:hypothetical protein
MTVVQEWMKWCRDERDMQDLFFLPWPKWATVWPADLLHFIRHNLN